VSRTSTFSGADEDDEEADAIVQVLFAQTTCFPLNLSFKLAAAPDRSPAAQLAQLAQQFLAAYHGALASQNAAQLAALYGADSVLCLDGQAAEGAANIAAHVIGPRLAHGPIQVRVAKCDAQAVRATGQVLLFLTGEATASPVSGCFRPRPARLFSRAARDVGPMSES
jgi:hypothetical protein